MAGVILQLPLVQDMGELGEHGLPNHMVASPRQNSGLRFLLGPMEAVVEIAAGHALPLEVHKQPVPLIAILPVLFYDAAKHLHCLVGQVKNPLTASILQPRDNDLLVLQIAPVRSGTIGHGLRADESQRIVLKINVRHFDRGQLSHPDPEMEIQQNSEISHVLMALIHRQTGVLKFLPVIIQKDFLLQGLFSLRGELVDGNRAVHAPCYVARNEFHLLAVVQHGVEKTLKLPVFQFRKSITLRRFDQPLRHIGDMEGADIRPRKLRSLIEFLPDPDILSDSTVCADAFPELNPVLEDRLQCTDSLILRAVALTRSIFHSHTGTWSFLIFTG